MLRKIIQYLTKFEFFLDPHNVISFLRNRPYKCKNCNTSLPAFLIVKLKANCCIQCGYLLEQTIDYLKNYFEIIQLSKELNNAKRLLLKSEFNSSIREASIIFENVVRQHSGLDNLYGAKLMSEAFSFKEDKNGKITKKPKIYMNDLSTQTKKNEQKAMEFLAVGLMMGYRNIYSHSSGSHKLYYTVQIITFIDLLLKRIIGWKL